MIDHLAGGKSSTFQLEAVLLESNSRYEKS